MNTEIMIQRLRNVIKSYDKCAVAVSGGVDSMTLAILAHRMLPNHVTIYHAISAAVPGDAQERIKRYADREQWRINFINAGELKDENYLKNPVNRCYYCKSCLYSSISKLTTVAIFSGTNMDDLADYRPGLEAAREHHVIHPFVEANIDKRGIRAIAQSLGINELAELPASPCLSSRIETGIAINNDDLKFVDRVETSLRYYLPEKIDVRCRIRPREIEIQLNEPSSKYTDGVKKTELLNYLYQAIPEINQMAVQIRPYRKGSSFIHVD